jgi:ubiquinone/menaquinone biosynthesis C-methylase UbiE
LGPAALRRFNRALFELSAVPYSLLTRGAAWRGHLRDMLPPLREDPRWPRLLDVGCGPGGCALELAAAGAGQAVGIDRSAPMIRRARAAAGARGLGERLALARGDAAALPFRAASFDALTAHSLLYLLPDPVGALREFRRVLAPGGSIALLEPAKSDLGARGLRRIAARAPAFLATALAWRLVSGAARRFTREGLGALLEEAGFAEVSIAPAFEGLALLARARPAPL